MAKGMYPAVHAQGIPGMCRYSSGHIPYRYTINKERIDNVTLDTANKCDAM
jgi:hypothetical protein